MAHSVTKSWAFRVFYYLNNTVFGFLFAYLLLIAILSILASTNSFGFHFTVKEEYSMTYGGSHFMSIILSAVALYHSFLALYSLKDGSFTAVSWNRRMERAALLFLVVMILSIIVPGRESAFLNIATQIGSTWIGITISSIISLLTSCLFYYLSGVVANDDNQRTTVKPTILL